jgi:hypothetical protein
MPRESKKHGHPEDTLSAIDQPYCVPFFESLGLQGAVGCGWQSTPEGQHTTFCRCRCHGRQALTAGSPRLWSMAYTQALLASLCLAVGPNTPSARSCSPSVRRSDRTHRALSTRVSLSFSIRFRSFMKNISPCQVQYSAPFMKLV